MLTSTITSDDQFSDMKNKSNTLIIYVALVLTTIVFIGVCISNASAKMMVDKEVSSLVVSSEIDTTWRYTKDGWQNTDSWSAMDTYVPRRVFEQMHPSVWASLVLVTVLGITIWASSEWDVDRLTEK